MIITRYIVREVLKSQLAIVFILLLIFCCQKLVRILSAAVNGDIPINLVLCLVSLGVPEMAQLILPLSLFLGLLMTLSRMYSDSEIIVMYACGLGNIILLRAAVVLSLMTTLIVVLNVVWMLPWSLRHQELLIAHAKANPSLLTLGEGQFKLADNGNLVLFFGSISNTDIEHIFLAQLKANGHTRSTLVIAERGHINQQADRSEVIILNKGTRYEWSVLLRNFYITDFTQYKTIIGHRAVVVKDNAEQMSLHQLWRTPVPAAIAELHWRVTLVVSVMIMAMIVVPISVIDSRQGRLLTMLPVMLLYLCFFLLQTLLRSNGAKGKLDPILWMWFTNMLYLALALILNIWDSVPARRLRWRLHIR